MSDVKTWSTTEALNSSASPNGWPENMSSAGLNDSGREVMAAIARWYKDSEWRDLSYGYTVSRINSTSFLVVSVDATTWFVANRRVRIVGATTADGFVENAVYAAGDTTVTVSMDAPGSDVPTSITAALVHHSATLSRLAFSGTIPTGSIIPFAGAVANVPNGYLICNGAELEKVSYPALWTAFGGHLYGTPTSPSTQFLLPNLGGKVPIGYVAGGDGDGDYGTINGAYGAKTRVLQTTELPAIADKAAFSTGTESFNYGAQDGSTKVVTGTHSHVVPIHNHPYGALGTAVDMRQPSVVLLWIVKT
jgi:microcystin-dependent protein